MGSRCRTGTRWPCLAQSSKSRRLTRVLDGGAVGALTTYIDDVLGCGGPDVLRPPRKYLKRRYGGPTAQWQSSVLVGMELFQVNDFSI